MSSLDWILVVLLLAAVACAVAGSLLLRRRNMHLWLRPYLFASNGRGPAAGEPYDVYLALCDHYEPECQGVSFERAIERVDRWVQSYPERFGQFRDVEGRPPQHTFFFPQDEYRPEYLDRLKILCEAGFGDVDVHLHHESDTADGLREKLSSFRDTLFHRHGLLRRDPLSGEIVYGFIHGNWALCNSRPDGYCCGVDQEITVLLETGCYADFTMPSAPSDTQTRTINSIYYACDLPGRRKSHDTGVQAVAGRAAPKDHLLMIQGPLTLDWSERKSGVLPRIENADVHAFRPATLRRFEMWKKVGVHVAGRPDQIFIKLHTHGCKDGNLETLLGPQTEQFHADLAAYAQRHPEMRLHYVTAWEMAQRVHQLEAGESVGGVERPPIAVAGALS